jgi:hypothetical protein
MKLLISLIILSLFFAASCNNSKSVIHNEEERKFFEDSVQLVFTIKKIQKARFTQMDSLSTVMDEHMDRDEWDKWKAVSSVMLNNSRVASSIIDSLMKDFQKKHPTHNSIRIQWKE